jgi:multiple sugar transport system ATP-binding protein
MIYVTHDQIEAMTLADKIVVLKAGEVQQIGAPMELYHRPANLFVAGFMGSPSMNFISASVSSCAASTCTVESPLLAGVTVPTELSGLRPGEQVTLGIRPQYLTLAASEADAQLSGTVEFSERLGTETVVDLSLSDGSKLVAAFAMDAVFTPGTQVHLSFDAARAHLFDQAGQAAHVATQDVVAETRSAAG